MSVFRPDEFERELQRSADDYRPADICFKCGEVLSSDEHLIVVSGIEGSPFLTDAEAYDGLCRPSPQLWLHAQCARDLAMELLKDYFAVTGVSDPYREARARLGFDE